MSIALPIRSHQSWRTKREWLIAVRRYQAGELRIDQLSGDELVLLTEVALWRPSDLVTLDHSDGSATATTVPLP